MMATGFSELLMILLLSGGPFSDFLGIPAGERDTQLAHAAATDSVLYVEWAARGEGKPGAPGVDGMYADPEMKQFVSRIMAAIKQGVSENVPPDAPQREMMGKLPEFALAFSGKPGCLFAAITDGPAPDSPMAALGRVKAGLVISAGDKADEFSATIAEWLAQIPGMQAPEKMERVQLPLPVPSFLHRHKDYLIVALGPKTLDEIIKGLDEGRGGIAENADFAAALKEVQMDRIGNIGWLDLKNGAESITEVMGPNGAMVPQVLEMAGLAGVEYGLSVTGVEDGKVRSRMKLKTDGKLKGLLTLGAGRGITKDDFAFVPADSDMVVAASIDAPKILAELRSFLSMASPGEEESMDEAIAEFEEEFDLDLEKDIFEAFGNVVTISNSPGDGGFVANLPVLTLEVRKPAGAFKTVAKFAEYFDKNGHKSENNGRRRGEYLERKEFMGQRIYMLNAVGDDGFVIAPSFTVTRSHFMLALHPQPLKSRIRRQKEASGWQSFAFTPNPAGNTISFSYFKIEDILPKIYGFLPWVTQSFMSDIQAEGFKIDTFDFPSARAMLPYMCDAHSTVTRTEDGFIIDGTRPPVIGAIGGTLPTMVPLLFGSRVVPMRIAEPAAFEAIPADQLAP